MTIKQKQWQLYYLGYYGVSDSRHLTGKAVDLRIEGRSAWQMLAWAQKQPEVRYAYAIDMNYIHMDIE